MKKSFKRFISISIVLALLLSAVGCSNKTSQTSQSGQSGETAQPSKSPQSDVTFNPGVYTGSALGKHGPVTVEVEFAESEIKNIKIVSHSETESIAGPAIEQLPAKIIEEQSIGVDVVAGATLMSDAILKAVEDCIVQAGGPVEKLKEAKTEATKAEEEVSTDIVVIGAGGAGTSAALAAVENGAKVILLEKTATPMGSSTLAGGMFAADSKQQKEKNATVSKEWLYDEYMKSSDGFMNSLLVRKIIDEAGATVDWLVENGCQLNLVDAGTGGGYEHIGKPATLHGYNEGGTVAITKLIDTYKSKGGEVRFSTPAKELLKDSEGNITGVIATKADGSTFKVNAKAVIIATGGFGGNDDMLKEYIGATYTKGEIGHNTGDGIKMAWDAGADQCGMGVAQYFWEKFTDEEYAKLADAIGSDPFILTNLTKFPNLRVNTLGKRFSNEINATLYSIHGAEISMQPQQTEYVILDSSMLDKVKAKGTASIEEQFGKWKDNPQYFMEFNEPNDTAKLSEEEHTPMDFAPLLDKAVGTGIVFKADTIEGLAKAMGVDEKTLLASVNQYNGAIKNGKDELFFSDPSRLISVDKAPYYAIKFVARNLGTLGGIRINENIEVVDATGMPINGLYAAGADAGGMYGKAYVDFEGATLGFAYTSGRLEGTNAASYVNGK